MFYKKALVLGRFDFQSTRTLEKKFPLTPTLSELNIVNAVGMATLVFLQYPQITLWIINLHYVILLDFEKNESHFS